MSQVKPTTQTVLLWITKSLWNRWRSRPNMLISTKPSTVSELHCHGSTARSPCVQATHAEFPLTSLLHIPSSWSWHSNAICVTFNISQIDTQISSLTPISVSSRLTWLCRNGVWFPTLQVSFIASYMTYSHLIPHTASHMSFLKTQISLSFSVCHLELNPQVLERPLQCLENPASGTLCIHLGKDTPCLLLCALAKLNVSASYRVFIFLSLLLSFMRCSMQPWARWARSSVFSDLRLRLQSWPLGIAIAPSDRRPALKLPIRYSKCLLYLLPHH